MGDVVVGPPWPDGPIVVDLDGLRDVTLADVAALERRREVSVGAVAGPCEGAALAAACAVDLLVAGPAATFGSPGPWADLVVRRGTGIAGRRVAAYLAMSRRTIAVDLARTWGVVTWIAPDPVAAAWELAERVAARSPVAVATILREAHHGAASDYTMAAVTGRVP